MMAYLNQLKHDQIDFHLYFKTASMSKVVSTHRTGTHPKQPLPTGYNGIPFIVGQGDCLGCALGVCCNFLGLCVESEIVTS